MTLKKNSLEKSIDNSAKTPKKANDNFTVGDFVVYPSHGVGEIMAEEQQMVAGFPVKLFVISFPKDKMVLHVPVHRAAASGLRSVSTGDELKKAMNVLKGRARSNKGTMWSRRAQEYETKINSGDIISIAEVVRDLHKNVGDPDRSYSERVIYEEALERLAGELAVIEKMEPQAAQEKLVEFLTEAA